MYSVFLTFFGYSIMDTADYKKALDRAKLSGYTCTIMKDSKVIATYCPIGGVKTYL